MTCVHCAKRPVIVNGVTCGNSYCQEASFHANAARNTKRKAEQAAHRKRQHECEVLASKWGRES